MPWYCEFNRKTSNRDLPQKSAVVLVRRIYRLGMVALKCRELLRHLANRKRLLVK